MPIETRLETLDQQWQTFCDTHRQIVSEFSAKDIKESIYELQNVYDGTEELYFDYKTILKEGLNRITQNSSKECSVTEVQKFNNNTCHVKLPKISIPMFSGLYTEWATFRDLFVSLIHKNDSLDEVQKLHYLKGHLTGEAENLLRHVPITATNYQVCWNQLRQRYDNKKYLADNILKRFMGMKQLQVESSGAIKDILDTTNECLHGLRNIGIDTSSWDIIVIHIVSQKLDPESRKLWEAKASENFDSLPTLTILNDFLEHRFRSLEFLSPKSYKPSVSRNTLANNNVQKSLHVSTLSCPFCDEN